MIKIIHGGQTGVDHGAHDAAVANKWLLGGFMPQDGCNELGPLQVDVRLFLARCRHKGLAERTKANLNISHALLVIVPNVQEPYATPGTTLTLKEARRLGLPRLVIDPTTHIPTVATWLTKLLYNSAAAEYRLMVAGPRESKWPGARDIAGGLLNQIASQLQGES